MRSATNVSFRLLNARSFDGDNGENVAAGAMVPTSRRFPLRRRCYSRNIQKVFTGG